MNVNLNSNFSLASKANLKPAVKEFQYFLNNGDKLICKHNDNLFDVLVIRKTSKGNMVVGAMREYNGDGIKSNDLEHVINQVLNAIDDSKKFLMEFIKSLRA